MALNRAWRVRWCYADPRAVDPNTLQPSGLCLQQYAEQSVDVIAAPWSVGPDNSINPDPAAIALVIGNNFVTPPGAAIILLGISSSQTPAVYS
jgi:hypothetical protein